MNDERFNKLVSELNNYIDIDGSGPSVSPTSPPVAMGDKPVVTNIIIDRQSDFESMTKNQRLLSHCLLHKFYSTGNKKLSKEDIKYLHSKIVGLINHEKFDRLDE